jgi:transposase-like protein
MSNDAELLKSLMKAALEEVLEGEMTEALGAEPGERNGGRQGYRAGYYHRGLVTRIGKLELILPANNGHLLKRYV